MLDELAMHLCHLAPDQAGVTRKRLAGWGRPDTAAAALKQLNLTEGFHIAQALAGGRQRKPHVCRSVGDAACIYHGEEQAKVDQVEAHTDDNIRHTAFGPAEVCLRIIHIVDADESVT